MPFHMHIIICGVIAVGLMTTMWISDHTVRKWVLARPCTTFSEKYDKVHEQIRQISCMDDLLSGELYHKVQ